MTMPRDKNTMFDESRVFTLDVVTAISATATIALGTVARTFRIERVELMSQATYAADATNYYTLSLSHGSGPTSAATWSTLTGADGAITAGTPVLMTLNAADANLVVPAGATLKLVATKVASGANILPRIVVHGRYVA